MGLGPGSAKSQNMWGPHPRVGSSQKYYYSFMNKIFFNYITNMRYFSLYKTFVFKCGSTL